MPRTAAVRKEPMKVSRAPRKEFEARVEFIRDLVKKYKGDITYSEIDQALHDKFQNVKRMDAKVYARVFHELGFEKHRGPRKEATPMNVELWGTVCHQLRKLMPQERVAEASFKLNEKGGVDVTLKKVITQVLPVG